MKAAFRIALCLLLLTGVGRAAEVVLRDPLDRAQLDAAWTVDVSKDNTIRATAEGLEIVAAEHTFAHLQRPLGIDHVRAQCQIKPGSGISWCSSLFLYWAPGDWCQLGVITRGNGRYYVCVMDGGRADEHDLMPCEFDRWHHLAIEIGEDILRFCSSLDGTNWTTQLILPRPSRFQGPPKLLVLGQGYGVGANTPDLDADYGARGPIAVSKIRDLVVTSLEAARVKMTELDRREREGADRDPLGAKELAAKTDPTFESVTSHLPALKRPREAVGVKDHPFELGVDWDGTIQLATEQDGWQSSGPKAFFEINGKRFGTGGCTKRLLNAGLPIVVSTAEQEGLICEQTVLGWSEGMRDDAPLWAYASLRVTPREPRTARVTLRIAPDSPPPMPGAVAMHLTNGRPAMVCYRIPSPLGNRSVAQVPRTEFDLRLKEATEAWTRLLSRGTQVTVPEPRVNDAWHAWLAYNFLNVDRKGDRHEIHDGSGFYEAIFGYSAALFCHALDLWGQHEDARRYLDSLLKLQRPDGLFFINYGYPDTGSLLFALAEHYRLTAERDWLKGVAPKMVKMCDWIIERRQASMKETDGKRPVTWGLVKFTPYCDFQEQTFDYYGDAYGCVSMEHTARVLGDLGMNVEAERLTKEAAAYRADIIASMDAAVIERGGLKVLPMEPDTLRLLKSTKYCAGGYYGLVASMMLESEFLPPRDPRARWVFEFMEKRRGLILGLCEFDRGVDHAYTYGYWLNCLRRDDIQRVLLGFYGSLAYGMGRDTYCGVEVTQIMTGDPTSTTPHTYSGTQQLRLLRMMLLREEGLDLLIGQGIPRHWLAPGQRIEIQNAPTHFGPLSLTIEPARDQTLVRLDPPRRSLPRAIQLRLRHPDHRAIARVEVDGKPVTTFTGETVTLDPRRETMKIQVWH